jgi:hypothetical protein
LNNRTNSIEKILNFHDAAQSAFCAGKVLKAFKELYDLDNQKYYCIEDFCDRIKNTNLHKSFVMIFGKFEMSDYERIIIGLNKACVLHVKKEEDGVSVYQFWNIQGRGLLDE